ncbi:MAG: RusA family crossover junction endodeoxyribonuclease [Patescibacteria group bacterium]|nr:RusA family crossover junction endodeoxyribonuclease [Patescibacteria group bacterium]
MIEIRVDGDPVGKGRPRFVRATGVAFTPEKTVSYENRVAWAAQQAMKGRPLLQGPLELTVQLYFSIPASKPKKWKADANSGVIRPGKKPDIDNSIKAIMDALNKVVYVDDGQIVHVCASKHYSDRPRAQIWIDNLSTAKI